MNDAPSLPNTHHEGVAGFTHPILLVHGIWNSPESMAPMKRVLESAGFSSVVAVKLHPNTGKAAISTLAEQVAEAADKLLESSGEKRLDVVGFSMGALVTRYWLQRLGGKHLVRRFVSISGPHAGTVAAWLLPFAGVRQMRRGSALLKDLNAEGESLAPVEVHTLRTCFDLMVFPSKTAQLGGALSDTRLQLWQHRFMITDSRALHCVVELLRAGRSAGGPGDTARALPTEL